MQVETPDPLLNHVIRSSQVRCLIAARNEAEGARVAPWIAAMSYGPLESEANSVRDTIAYGGRRYSGYDPSSRTSDPEWNCAAPANPRGQSNPLCPRERQAAFRLRQDCGSRALETGRCGAEVGGLFPAAEGVSY